MVASYLKSQYIWYILPLVVFTAITYLLFANLTTSNSEKIKPMLRKGTTVPEFTLPPINDTMTGLSKADLNNHYSLVNIFASWCVSCLEEHALLMDIKNKNLLPIYGINWRDEKDNINYWLKKNGNPYTKIGSDFRGDVIISLGVTAAPETFLISPDNKIIFHHTGPLTLTVLKNEILPIINY